MSTTIVKVTIEDPRVSFTDAQQERFLAAVSGALARQAAEVLAPSGYETFAYVMRFQLTADNKEVEGWLIELDKVNSFGLTVKVGYQLTHDDEFTDYNVTVMIEFVYEAEDPWGDDGRGYHDPDIGQEFDIHPDQLLEQDISPDGEE